MPLDPSGVDSALAPVTFFRRCSRNLRADPLLVLTVAPWGIWAISVVHSVPGNKVDWITCQIVGC